MTATHVGTAWSSTVRLVVDDARVLRSATTDLHALLDQVEGVASRFRTTSALSLANRLAGRPVPVPKLLVSLVDAALTAAKETYGAVDPTVGAALRDLGYDRDIADVRATPVPSRAPRQQPLRLGSWTAVRLHRDAGLLTVPLGTELDLGATAKAWTADHAAAMLARRYGCAVLVELGGDVAVAGARPDGWCVRVAEHEDGDGDLLLIREGGVTTSTTTVRRWQQGDATVHHIVDPVSGRPTGGPWRTASVAAKSALAANTASTAAIVLGADAEAWLTSRNVTARLVGGDGEVVAIGAWPRNLPHVCGSAR